MYQDGAPGILSYPMAQAAVLASVAAASGVPTPTDLSFNSVPLSPSNSTVILLPPNAARTFLLIYNIAFLPAQFSLGNAVQGGMNNLSIGPGQVYFWANAQGLAPVFTGQLTAVGLWDGLPLWVWEDGGEFYDNGGTLAALRVPTGYPTSYVGLPVGAIWSNGLEIAVVPGFVPNPAAAPVFFGSITAATLLAMGGGNLPLSDPGLKSQLWNDGGTVAISGG